MRRRLDWLRISHRRRLPEDTDSPVPRPRAGQRVEAKEEEDNIWLVNFMVYDIGYFDLQSCRVEPLDNPFGPKVLSMLRLTRKTWLAIFR